MMMLTCGVCGWSGKRAEQDQPYIAWCPGCQTGLTVPPPRRDNATDAVFKEAGSYHDRLRDRPQWRAEAAARLAWLRDVGPPPGTVMELGAATGEFVEAAESAGFDIVGVEPSAWASEQAASLTGSVFLGDLTAYRAKHPNSRFAAVVMFHTLEHVPEPADLLREVRGVLATDGILLIEVPNAGTQSADDDGRDWWMRSLADHVHHFRPEGLALLLRECGYRPDVLQQTLRSAYGGPAPSPRDRLRALVRARRLRESRDLLRVVARL